MAVVTNQAAPGGVAGLVYVTNDLSTWTKIDTGSLEDASTSLGTSSDVVVAAAHGMIDSGLDGLVYVGTIDASFNWAGHHAIALEITCSTWPTGSGVDRYIHAGVMKAGTLASGNGIFGGVRIRSNGAWNVSRITMGHGVQNNTTDCGTPELLKITIPLSSAGYETLVTTLEGATTDKTYAPLDDSEAPTALILAVAFGSTGTPGDTTTYTGLQVKHALVTVA